MKLNNENKEGSRILPESKAGKLAETILLLDHSIRSVGIIDQLGVPMAGAIRKDLRGELPQDKRAWESKAFRAAAIMGSARTDDGTDSTIISIELIRENSKTLLVWVPEKKVTLAIVFEMGKSGAELSDAVRRHVGLVRT